MYGRHYSPTDIPYDKLTHVMFSFSKLSGANQGNDLVNKAHLPGRPNEQCFPGFSDIGASFANWAMEPKPLKPPINFARPLQNRPPEHPKTQI